MTDDEIRDIFAELRRIGVDLGRPPGLALGTGFREGEFLPWLHRLPDNLGHDSFVEQLNGYISRATPNVVLDDGAPLPTPHRYSPTVEQVHAAIDILMREWDPLGARLGELARDDLAIPAYNAVYAIVCGGPTRDVEARVAANLRGTESEVYGVRASPLIQTRYLVRRIMQAVAEHPGPPHEFDPFERLHHEAVQAEPAEAVAPGVRRGESRGRTVQLGPRGDEPTETLDPDASCDDCGATGTVAWVTREIEPLLSRYCLTCWRQVRHKYYVSPERPHDNDALDKDSPELKIAVFEHVYEYARERPRSCDSALWEDKAPFVRMGFAPQPNEAPSDHERRLKQLANELASLAPRMYGPIPPDIEAFVQRYAAPDA